MPDIETPALLLYADKDPVVAPKSAAAVFEKLGAADKRLHKVKAERHGILMENLGETWALIDEFLNQRRYSLTGAEIEHQPLRTEETAS